MIITPDPHPLDFSTSDLIRSQGLHASDIYGALYARLDPKRYDYGGGWRIHGQYVKGPQASEAFSLDAGEVVLSAGSLNSTEILLRSEMHGLPVSPALGTGFNGNGDFFGLAYNGDYETDVLGYLHTQAPAAGDSPAPGPNIVGLVRYTQGLPEEQRVAIEDFSFPNAYIDGAKAA